MDLDTDMKRILHELLPSEQNKLAFIEDLMNALGVESEALRTLGKVSEKYPLPSPPEACLPFMFKYNFGRWYFLGEDAHGKYPANVSIHPSVFKKGE